MLLAKRQIYEIIHDCSAFMHKASKASTFMITLNNFKVYRISDWWFSGFFILVNFDGKSTLAFWSRGTYVRAKLLNWGVRDQTWVNCYSSGISGLERPRYMSGYQLWITKSRTFILRTNFILVNNASYSTSFLLVLNEKREDSSIITPLGPSNITLTPIPCRFEGPSIERTQTTSFTVVDGGGQVQQ